MMRYTKVNMNKGVINEHGTFTERNRTKNATN